MLNSYARDILAEADHLALAGEPVRTLAKLRELPLADFCQLLLEIGSASHPNLTRVLPRMPSEQDQKHWTGHSGAALMIKSCNVARLFDIISYRTTGTGLRGKSILDYGCGWGRLLRLMYYYSDTDLIYGIDPSERSLAVCRTSGITQNLALCDAIPKSIPFLERQFDFAFSFSVFTHLSEDAARAVLRACRQAIAPHGVYVVTIRPEEFWTMRKGALGELTFESVVRQHRLRGFAFTPITAGGQDISATYGDASMTFDFMRRMAYEEGWTVSFFDRDMTEPCQVVVTLQPQ